MAKMKTTQKAIKAYNATDLTNDGRKDKDLYNITNVGTIAYSMGVYGMNGIVFEGNDGHIYKVTARNTALFLYM
jgi:hypothetical protein